MTEQPPNPGPGAEQPGPEDSTRRDSEAMLGGKPSRDPLVGTTVDQYSIKRVIGEGGMGVVYEALQQSPRRTVALKMMKRGVTSKSAMRRFEYEAQTLGRLRHDGIAQIYQAGTWDDGTGGKPWFAMEYIQGAKSLTRYCKDKKLGTRERLDIFSKVCAAVQHGHAKGIIHRDLKPGNILVTSSGVPKVIDFGVARSTDSDMAVTTLQTDVGALIGTLQYMSPEQCDADPNDIDTRSDVYALGVVLYELLCDQLPYALRHAAIHEAARIIREEEPTKPSSLDKRLRGDIETITLKALEKDRDRRYQSATALEEDIDRYLAGDPIAAKAPSAIDYLKRFTRKHKAAAVSIVAVFIVLVGAVIAISIFAVEAERQRKEAEIQRNTAEMQKEMTAGMFAAALQAEKKTEQALVEAKQQRDLAKASQAEAEQQRDEARRQAYYANIRVAGESVRTGDIFAARRGLEKAREAKGNPPEDQLPFEWRLLSAQCEDALIVHRVWNNDGSIMSVASSPDGQLVAAATPAEKAIILLDSETGERLRTLPGHLAGVSQVAFSPDGTQLASGSRDGSVRLWDPNSGKALHILGEATSLRMRSNTRRGMITGFAFSPDGTRLAEGRLGNPRQGLSIWDTRTGELLSNIPDHGVFKTIHFSPDSAYVAVIGGTIYIWDSTDGSEVRTLLPREGTRFVDSFTLPVNAYSPDGAHLFCVNQDNINREENSICILDVNTGEELRVLDGHDGAIGVIALSLDGTCLASGGSDRTIRLWDTATGTQMSVLRGHEYELSLLAFDSEGATLASVDDDNIIRLWDVASGSLLRVLRGHEGIVSSLHFDPDSRTLVSGSEDGTVRIWDLNSNEKLSTLDHGSQVSELIYSADGSRMASFDSSYISIWDTATNDKLLDIPVPPRQYWSRPLCLDSSGTRVASAGGPDHAIYIWETTTGVELATLRGHVKHVTTVAFSPEGSRIASGGWDGSVRIWDTATGEELSRPGFGLGGGVNSLLFDHDGTRLFSSGEDGDIRIWDVTTGKELNRLPGHRDFVAKLAISPDGARLASASWDNTVRIWDVDSGNELRTLRAHKDSVNSVAFTPNGRRLASGSSDDTIRLWDVDSGEEMATLVGHQGSVLTVVFSPDGNRLASGGGDEMIRFWDTRTRAHIIHDRKLALQQHSDATSNVGGQVERENGNRDLVLQSIEAANENRRLARQRAAQLAPLVDGWFETAGGQSDVVLAMLERERNNRSTEEFATIQNLVLLEFTRLRERGWLTRWSKDDWDNNPEGLNTLAWEAATTWDALRFDRTSDEVLRIAQRACELTDYEYAAYLDTLARVHFERGELAEAIKWQELAMQHIPEGDDKGTYQESLDRYREAVKQDAQE